MKGKKGISPLIATVLIIGFTIVLAALVLQWGGDLFKGVQTDTAKTSEFKIACATKLVGLELSAGSDDEGLFLTMDNKNDYDSLVGARYRVYDENDAMITGGEVLSDNGKISPFEIKDFDLEGDGISAKTVGVFPIILVKGEQKTCESELRVAIEGDDAGADIQ